MAKTDWKMDDTVMPADMNQVGEEINKLGKDVNRALNYTSLWGIQMSVDDLMDNGDYLVWSNAVQGLPDVFDSQNVVISVRGVKSPRDFFTQEVFTEETIPYDPVNNKVGTWRRVYNKGLYGPWVLVDPTSAASIPFTAEDFQSKNVQGAIMEVAAVVSDNKAKLDTATNLATADAIVKRDASGRAKVAAPAVSDDIARKAEVDASITSAANDATTKVNSHAARVEGTHSQVNSITVAGIGWYRVASFPEQDGRGDHLISVFSRGGSYNVSTLEIRIQNSNGTPVSIHASVYGSLANWNSIRITRDSGSTTKYLEVYFNMAITNNLAVAKYAASGLVFNAVLGNNVLSMSPANTEVLASIGQLRIGYNVGGYSTTFVSADVLESKIQTVAPFRVASNIVVPNLNTELHGGWKRYSSLSELGLTNTSTIDNIFTAMPVNSILEYISPTQSAPLYLFTGSMIRFVKVSATRMYGSFVRGVPDQPRFYQSIYASDATTKWSGWALSSLNDGTLQTNLNADMLDGMHATNGSAANSVAARQANGNLQAVAFVSTAPEGTAPIQVTSKTTVTNLNADMLDGMHASSSNANNTVVSRSSAGDSGFNNVFAARQLISEVATGTAPLKVSSTTAVANLNADMVDGYHVAITNTPSTLVLRGGDGSISGNEVKTYAGTSQYGTYHNVLYNSGKMRFAWGLAGLEGENDVGSDLLLWSNSDANTLGYILSANRATQVVNFFKSPTAPTPASGSNDTKIATTAFVQQAIAKNQSDFYEEGTWTPVLAFGTASTGIAYSSRAGRYIRMGKLVYAKCYIALSNKGTATGQANVSGLPFNSAATQPFTTVNITQYDGIKTTDVNRPNMTGELYVNSNKINFLSAGLSSTGRASLVNDAFANNTWFVFDLTYTI